MDTSLTTLDNLPGDNSDIGFSIQTLMLWDSSAELPGHDGLVYRWNGYAEKDSVHSLLQYVETHRKRLRHKYLAWIHDLGESRIDGKRLIDHLTFEDGLSYWWMTLLVEKSPYKSPITDAIRLLAMEEIIIQQKPRKLRLVSANRWLHEAISALCQRLKINYEWERVAVESRRLMSPMDVYRTLPQLLQAAISLARHTWGRWPLRCTQKSSWFSSDQSLFLCSYFDNIDPKVAEDGYFYSYYWTELHALLNRIGCQRNWLQLFIPCTSISTPHAAMSRIQNFNQTGKNHDFHAFLDAYLSWHIILRVLKRWLQLTVIAWRLRGIKHAFYPQNSQFSLWPLMRENWKASMYGPAAINNLLSIELLDVALCDIPHQKKGLYLCENQAWERALIHAWRKHGHGQLIAVVHSTVRFWDLRYFTDSRTIRSLGAHPMPQADRIALNGRAAVDAFLCMAYPKEAIVECEALRYGYLSRLKADCRSKHERDPKKKVLVLGDIMPAATARLLELLEASIPHCSDTMTYDVKAHPNCPVSAADFPSLNFETVTDPLGMILQNYDIAYASNGTSAAVDAYFFGLPVVVMLDEMELNISPLRGQADVCFVNTPEELAKALQTAHQNLGRKAVSNDFFFLDPELPRWSHLIAN